MRIAIFSDLHGNLPLTMIDRLPPGAAQPRPRWARRQLHPYDLDRLAAHHRPARIGSKRGI